ncbi:MAG: hypothetical protein KGK11_05415 [Sphingomonadales bacterium]|nr:hypothetical protein [Sphingomonadales bacterium]
MAALSARKASLETRIAAARARLLRNARGPDHARALEELTARAPQIQPQARREAEAMRVTSCEKTILDWVDQLTARR